MELSLAFCYSALRGARKRLRPIFHWQYSGWLIALCIPMGLSMPFLDQYLSADGFFIVAGIAGGGFWLTSTYLGNQRQVLGTRDARRNPSKYRGRLHVYRLKEWLGLVLIFLITGVGLLYVGQMAWERRSEDVQKALRITLGNSPGKSSLHTAITVINESSVGALTAKHRIACKPLLAVGAAGTSSIQGDAWFWQYHDVMKFDYSLKEEDIPITSPVLGSGDGVTEQCLGKLAFQNGTDCADIKVVFQYYLQGYPDRLQEKQARFVVRDNGAGTMEWHQQPYDAMQSYCADLVSPSNPTRRGAPVVVIR